jgi:alkylhydroperoxidase family enzyme
MVGRMSRFKIHDDETAPERSIPVLKGASKTAGQVPNLLGVLAGSPSALRAYVRMHQELRHSSLPRGTAERIALAVAELHGSEPDRAQQALQARRAGLGLDEITRARNWRSNDADQDALLRWLKPLARHEGEVAAHLHEEAHEVGWTDEQLLESVAIVAQESLAAMVNVAGDVPVDGSSEETRLRAVA